MALGGRLRAGPLLLVALALLATLFTWSPGRGQFEVDLHERVFVRSDQQISAHSVGLTTVSSRLPNEEAWHEFIADQNSRIAVFIDPRSGTPANLIVSIPLIPGDGVGNTVTLPALGGRLGLALTEVTPESVGQAVRQYVLDNAETFAIDGSQLGLAHAVAVHERHWEVSIAQQVNGVLVRDSRIAASVIHGNLVLLGTSGWGNATLNTTSAMSGTQARDRAFQYAGGRREGDVVWQEPALLIVPYAPASRTVAWDPEGPVGGGYAHRLAWSVGLERAPDEARWEALVDAQTGEILV